jgi:exodeoxyribonuclease VIII
METLTEQPEQETVQVPLTREQYTVQLILDIKSGKTKLSYTAISKFKRSPKCFIDYKLAPKEQTDAMLLGSIVHCLILEPEHFDERYTTDALIIAEIGGAKPRSTTKYKEWKAEQEGMIVISSDFHKAGQDMANAVLNNSAAKWVLDQCDKREFRIEWNHKGLSFIGFMDARGKVIADIKICQDAEPKKFQRDIINMGYYLQGGAYTIAEGEVLPYFLIAVDRNLGVSVHEVTEDLIEFGMNEFDRLCGEFNTCLDANDFHKSFEYRSHTDQGYFKVSRPPYLT